MTPTSDTSPPRSVLDRGLGLFSEVRGGEGLTGVLLLANLFCVLVAYYVIKVVREPLILASGGAEQKAYASAYQALVLMGFVPLYSWFSSKVGRMKLIVGVTLLFVANIELFFLGARAGVPKLGIIFYVWVGIFSLAVIAQFWSFANDIYPRKVGERLFPIVGIGATLGAPLGAGIARQLSAMRIDPYSMLHISAGILLLNLLLYWVIQRRPEGRAGGGVGGDGHGALKRSNGFTLVLRNPYIRLIAGLMILLNLVNTTGEYIVSAAVADDVVARVAAETGNDLEATRTVCLGKGTAESMVPADAEDRADRIDSLQRASKLCKAHFGTFYGDFFLFVNIIAALLQAFFVSRIVKTMGIPGVLFALPLVAFGAYGLIALGLGLGVLRSAKTAENATDYSVMNTAKAMLWLPTSREDKYNAKQAVDTFFVRLGDLASAALVWTGVKVLGLGVRGFALVNLGIIAVWLLVARRLLTHYRQLVALKEGEEEAIKTTGSWQVADIRAALRESEQRVRDSQMDVRLPEDLRRRMRQAYEEQLASKRAAARQEQGEDDGD